MPEDLVRQIEPLHELVRAHGWPLLMVEGVEADDVIGTLATQAAAAGIDCVISTSDKDLAQLVRPGIKLVNTMSNETLDEAGVVAKFGVRADQVLDLLALTGDAVDNVPGVAKVGPKTAAKWLAQFGTLDAVIGARGRDSRRRRRQPARDARLAAAGQAAADGEDRLRACRWRPPISGSVRRMPTGCGRCTSASSSRAGCATATVAGPGGDAAGAIADRAARENTRKFSEPGARDAQPAGDPPPAGAAPLRDRAGRGDAAALAARDRARGARRASTPRRPDSTRCARRSSGCRSRSSRAHACYIPLAHRYPGVADQLPLDATLARFARWFADPARKKLGQNVKYDQHVLANHGLALDGVAHDTLLESYVLEAHRPHDMDNLAWRHLNVKTITYAEVAGKGAKQIGFDQVSIADATAYSAEDADITLQLHRCLYPRVAADPKLDHVYAAIEMPVREVLFEMEREGVMLDTALLAAQSRRARRQGDGTGGAGLSARRAAVQPRVAEAAGRDPVRQDEAADAAQDGDRPAVDGRGGADRARGRLPAAEGPARAPRAVEAEVDLHGQAAADGESAHRSRAHDVQPGDGGHRPARVVRPEPAEHPGAHGRRPAHPRGVHRAAGTA